ncbi:MAG: EamA family transporter [Thermoanaerobaculia bacterium]
MGLLTLAVALAVASNVLYHVSQKSIPGDAHPLASLTVTYLVALVVTLLLWPLFPSEGPALRSLGRLNWASYTVGVAIVGVEAGILLAYRGGLRVSVGSTTVNVAVALLLIPVGILFFRERLSFADAAGVVLCLAGLVLIVGR